MKLRITIDQIVMEGVGEHIRDRLDLQQTIETALSRLLLQHVGENRFVIPASLSSLSGGMMHLDQRQPISHQIGNQIAHTVYKGISNGPENSHSSS